MISLALIGQVIDNVVFILTLLIIIRAFLSFLPQIKPNKFTILLKDLTDPLLKPFQRFQLGGAAMALDFSPIFAIIALNVIGWLSKWVLYLLF
ncbi:MAG: YggT family protein [Desulfosporosinus sp.]|jgi:YggT family protein